MEPTRFELFKSKDYEEENRMQRAIRAEQREQEINEEIDSEKIKKEN